MEYEVILQDSKTAIIERTDRDDALTNVYFSIVLASGGSIEDEGGKFIFNSLSHIPEVSGDPRGYNTIGRNYQGKSAIKREIEAGSLTEACTKFFSEWKDTFRMTGQMKDPANAIR